MIEKISIYFNLFLIYSFIGWAIEVIRTIQFKKHFVNRGYLIGPICPIYGVGSLIAIITLTKYKSSPIVLFCMAIIIFSILEYFTSYLMEKIFKARWWDYSDNKYNLNGRICAETMIPFGLLGCLVIYLVNPLIMNLLNKVPTNIITWISLILSIIFILDIIISTKIMIGFKITFNIVEKDGTEEITKKVREVLLKRNFLYKRVINAFPNFINPKEYLRKIREKAYNDLKKYLK